MFSWLPVNPSVSACRYALQTNVHYGELVLIQHVDGWPGSPGAPPPCQWLAIAEEDEKILLYGGCRAGCGHLYWRSMQYTKEYILVGNQDEIIIPCTLQTQQMESLSQFHCTYIRSIRFLFSEFWELHRCWWLEQIQWNQKSSFFFKKKKRINFLLYTRSIRFPLAADYTYQKPFEVY